MKLDAIRAEAQNQLGAHTQPDIACMRCRPYLQILALVAVAEAAALDPTGDVKATARDALIKAALARVEEL